MQDIAMAPSTAAELAKHQLTCRVRGRDSYLPSDS